MESWVVVELQYAADGDRRRDARLVKIVEALAGQPNASVPQACGHWAATQAA